MFNFKMIPEVKDVDIAFSVVRTNTELLLEARTKGFYNGHTKFNDMFSNLFFSGGVIAVKPSISAEDKTRALRYYKALAGSFEPKHEEKEAVCALILSVLCD